ncbi:Ca2+-binding RTX toxin-like protein [Amaricoccus macauensis]|uniref:Ca2+-binding RTX toxin-like protein n=1 Tax=Amaricoccus macauensis TaxID=57001 RepID=A0A840SK21_9RHOB|nr:calcium-binding protein [Amaricoccus macauensis]MBB5220236.1 Ca2+-binding RTX toxin-like protein [Amaricoccus macauensis]
MATIFGTNGADALLGTARADEIHGLWGDDTIEGVDGRDFLYGGMGNDTLDGGAGPDFIDGEGGYDMVLYSSNTTPVWADLRTGVVTFPGQSWPAETLLNIEAIDGGTGSDRFIGSGAGNHFWGSTGNDTLVGNYGADTLLGGGGADSLEGGNGLDSLEGGFGDDTMRGDLHNDLFRIGAIGRQGDDGELALVDFGRDLIDGGAGTDTLVIDGPPVDVDEFLVYVREAPAVRANLGTGTLRLGDSPNRSTLISIENIETGSGADSINGSSGDNLISAGDGANVVYAGAGNDTIIGGDSRFYYDGNTGDPSPVELLNGGDGDDVIYGMGSTVNSASGDTGAEYPGTDILAGGNGNDTIYGGAAIQFMSGGTGNDLFVLSDELSYTHLTPSMEITTITDFERGKDKIGFDFVDFTGTVTFRGAMAPEDMEVGDLAYFRDGAETIVRLQTYEDGEMNGFDSVVIVLTGYIGQLSASDFDLG